jgi:hypothetical protein
MQNKVSGGKGSSPSPCDTWAGDRNIRNKRYGILGTSNIYRGDGNAALCYDLKRNINGNKNESVISVRIRLTDQRVQYLIKAV